MTAPTQVGPLRAGDPRRVRISVACEQQYGATRAQDIRALIELVIKTVKEKHGVDLELEVELVGEW